LKSTSINSHRVWVESGKPRTGNIFDAKAKAKLLYKNCVKQHQKEEVSSVSNSLHDVLIVKDNVTFLKMCKNKMGGKKPVATTINGSKDEREIVNKFANYFEGVGNVLHTKFKDFRALLQDKLKLYSGDEVCYTTIDVELVDTIIRNLDSGKASGADMLSSEHLLYCHPIGNVLLTKLF